MRVAVIATDDDPLAQHILSVARSRGDDAQLVSFHHLARGAPAAFDGDAWLYQGEELDSFDAFVVRTLPGPIATVVADPAEVLSAERWWRRLRDQEERAHFAESCLIAFELAGKPVVNPRLRSGPFDQKPLQLAAFQRAGLPIPRTLISNFPDAVRLFAGDVGAPGVIYKPVGGGAETQVLDEAASARLGSISASPVIFQERVPGPDIRVTVVAGEVVSAVEIPTFSVDYRSDAAYRRGEQRYVEHALPAAAASLCARAAEICGHTLSGIDLKQRASGEYVLLEANSSPVYLDVERKTGHPITARLLDALASGR